MRDLGISVAGQQQVLLQHHHLVLLGLDFCGSILCLTALRLHYTPKLPLMHHVCCSRFCCIFAIKAVLLAAWCTRTGLFFICGRRHYKRAIFHNLRKQRDAGREKERERERERESVEWGSRYHRPMTFLRPNRALCGAAQHLQGKVLKALLLRAKT